MKFILLSTICALIFIVSCTSEKDSDLEFDCTQSDLTIELNSVSNASCNSGGKFEVLASGGSTPYNYTLDGSGKSNTDGIFSDIGEGSYTVSVEDSNGCKQSTGVSIISEDGTIVISVVSQITAGCGTADGQLEVSVSGGNGTYEFIIDDGTAQNSGSFSSLASGAHNIKVNDSNGCSTTSVITISSGTSLNDDIMPIITSVCATSNSCHGTGASGRPEFTSKATVIEKASRIKARTQDGSMPAAGSLSQTQIDLIACWVDDGAIDN